MKTASDSPLPDAGTEPEALIMQARRRQHRRYLVTGVAIAAVAAAAVAVIGGSGAGGRPRSAGPPRPPGRHALAPAPARVAALVTAGQTSLPRGHSLSLVVGYRAVWVTGIGITYKIDEASGRIVRTIPTPGTSPDGCGSGIAAGAGAVWVTHGCQGVYRIDPRSGRVTASLRVAGVGDGIAVADALVWVTSENGDLLRIQPGTGQIIGQPLRVGLGEWAITPGAGTLWVTSYGSGNSAAVRRVDLATGAVSALRNLTVSDVEAVGAGSLWTSQVQRVDPATGRVIASVFVPGAAQVAFWKGSAWALTEQRSLTFLRIDPATNQVTGTPVPVGQPLPAARNTEPTAIATGPTGLWVLDFSRNLLFRLVMRPAA